MTEKICFYSSIKIAEYMLRRRRPSPRRQYRQPMRGMSRTGLSVAYLSHVKRSYDVPKDYFISHRVIRRRTGRITRLKRRDDFAQAAASGYKPVLHAPLAKRITEPGNSHHERPRAPLAGVLSASGREPPPWGPDRTGILWKRWTIRPVCTGCCSICHEEVTASSF